MENNLNNQQGTNNNQHIYPQNPNTTYPNPQYNNNPQGYPAPNPRPMNGYQSGTGQSTYYNGQQQYHNPYPSQGPYDPYSEPMKIKDWLVTMLLMLIPIANIILVFVWAFSRDVNKSKKTFFQASLIFSGIVIGIYIVIFLIIFLIALSAASYLW